MKAFCARGVAVVLCCLPFAAAPAGPPPPRFVGADRASTDARLATPDGRYVVVHSNATNLVRFQSDANNTQDVFVFDRTSSEMRLVSHTTANDLTTGNAASSVCGMSPDGSRIVFTSSATNLASGPDTNGGIDVFVWESSTGTVRLVSHAHDAPDQAGNGSAFVFQGGCRDAERIVFQSAATDVLPGVTDDNASNDVFLADLANGTRRLLSHAFGSPTTTANGLSFSAELPAGGQRVLLTSRATNLIANIVDTVNTNDVFVWDEVTDTFALVSHTAAGENVAIGGNALSKAISADGGFVLFESGATTIVPGQVDTNSVIDLFHWSRATGEIKLVSHAFDAAARAANSLSATIRMSDDGAFVAFESIANNVVAGDTNGVSDNFLWSRASGTNQLIGDAAGSSLGLTGSAGPQRMTRNGRWVLSNCRANDIVAGGTPLSARHVCLWDRTTGAKQLVTHAAGAPSLPANGSSHTLALGENADWALYWTHAPDVVAGIVEGNTATDVYLWERATNTSRLVSHTAGVPTMTAAGQSNGLALTDDGATVLLTSSAIDLVAGGFDTNAFADVFVWDRASATTTLVSAMQELNRVFGNGFE